MIPPLPVIRQKKNVLTVIMDNEENARMLAENIIKAHRMAKIWLDGK